MAFKDVLKSLRKEKGFTQEQLADEMGLSKSAISMYETGNRKPDYEALEAFADMFNVDMNTLLDSPSSKNLSLPNSEISFLFQRPIQFHFLEKLPVENQSLQRKTLKEWSRCQNTFRLISLCVARATA